MKIYLSRQNGPFTGETTTVVYFTDIFDSDVFDSDGDPWEDVLFVRIHHCVKTWLVGGEILFLCWEASMW